ncbi:condensation domain-containing protein [Streptomyces sp. NPDC086787]|uniref:condensation domain-containing protein n=1 Tax=Streptomyces sp. NPDC086787 TaxID=3365759 RepID=UPI0038086347
MATRKETDLWLLERLVPGAGVNNLSVTFDVDGVVEPAALARALTLVVRRQEILRTVFRATDSELIRSVLAPDAVAVPVPGTVLEEADDGDVQAAVERFVGAPFALDGSLLVRGAVFTRDADGDGGTACTVSVALHHLVFDAMSTVSFLGELLHALQDPEGYDTTPVAAAVEPEPAAESVEFWREQLRGFRGGDEAGLWFGNPPSDTPDLAGESTWYTLSRPARSVVRRLCRELRAPEAVILLSAYCLLLSRHGAGRDLVVGSPVSVRPDGHESAIGYHVNVLPLRVRIDPAKPFKRLVNRVRSVFLEGIGHSGVPAELVLDEVRDADGGGSWRNSLCTHLFNYVPGGTSGDFAVCGLPARMRDVENGFSKFDLEFFFMPEGEAEGEDELRIRAVFRTQVFSAAEVGLLLARYDALLVRLGEELSGPVGELSVWSDADRAVVAGGHRNGLPAALPYSPAVAQFSSYTPGEWSAVRALVAAPDGSELPVRVRGELCLAEADGTVRRTGELARWLPDGRLELLGRLDRRVTVRGFAFGLDEVDAVLLAHAEVAEAASVAVAGRVVSFVAPTGGGPAEGLAERLLKQIRVSLPAAAEPDRVVVVDALPSVGGRPDLEGLRLRAEALTGRDQPPATATAVDTDELTDQLIVLWREFLKREDLKAGSGFFSHGGHSLLGVQLLQRIKRTTDVKVRIRLADLFAHPTPRGLAGFIADRSA